MNFKNVAKNLLAGSIVMQGREKITTREICEDYPDGITVREFDILEAADEKTGEIKRYPVFGFEENPDKYFNGGALLLKIAEGWAEEFDSVEDASAELNASGGVKIKLKESRTKKGNSLTLVEIVG